ncbi:hypothetical protein WA158_007671 [Blastocystis sp. Blastoise]
MNPVSSNNLINDVKSKEFTRLFTTQQLQKMGYKLPSNPVMNKLNYQRLLSNRSLVTNPKYGVQKPTITIQLDKRQLMYHEKRSTGSIIQYASQSAINNVNPNVFYQQQLNIFQPLSMRTTMSDRVNINQSSILSKEGQQWLVDILNPDHNYIRIFLGSVDTFSARAFHRLCDNHKDVVVIIKAIGSNNQECIFGGYSSVGWGEPDISAFKNTGWRYDDKSFLFSIDNPHKTGPIQLPVISAKDAIVQNPSSLACFCSGIYIEDQCNNNNRSFIGCKTGIFQQEQEFGSSLFVNTNQKGMKNFFKVIEIEVFSSQQ